MLAYIICIITTTMSARHFIHVLKSAYRGPTKTPLGRWNIHNHTQTKLKIKYANEDNCGSCGDCDDHGDVNQPAQQYNYQNIQPQVGTGHGDGTGEGDELYLYMMGVESVPDCRHTIG